MTIHDMIAKLSGNKMANNKQRKSHSRYTRHPQQIAALNNLLSQFADNLSLGYSDEAWVQASHSMRRLSGYLFQPERETLATAWRNCYVDGDFDAVCRAVDQVRARL